MSPQSNLDSDAVPYIFFLFIGLVGIVGSFSYWNQTGAFMLETGGWQRVPCQIVHSDLRESGLTRTPWEFDVRYRYSLHGEKYDGSRFRLGPRREGPAFANRSDVESLVRRYREGDPATCFVNPADPSESALERRPVLHAFAAVIPGSILLFSAIGLILTARWLPDPVRRKRLPKVILGAFAFIAVGVGLAMGSVLALRPALIWLDARDWRQVTAVVERSEADYGGGPVSGGGPYWDLRYRYEVDGKTYYGDDYSPLGRGTYTGLESLAAQYPPDTTTSVWIDPARPDRAYLTRRIPFLRLIPALALLLVPAFAAAALVVRIVRRKAAMSTS